MKLKLIKNLHLLRVWNPKNLKIRRQLFFRSQILVGSDRSAHFRVAELEGLSARLDLEAAEVTHLADGKVESIEPGRIIELGELALQWKLIALFQSRWIWPVSVLLVGLCLMGLGGLFGANQANQAPCSEFASYLRQGRWIPSTADNEGQRKILSDLSSMRASFLSAMKTRNLLVARGELQAMSDIIDKISVERGCDVRFELDRLESRFSELRIQLAIKENKILEAAEEFGRLASSIQNRKVERIEKRLRRMATELYIKGYQSEDIDPEKAEELMDQAEQVCLALKREPDCYRVRGGGAPTRSKHSADSRISDE